MTIGLKRFNNAIKRIEKQARLPLPPRMPTFGCRDKTTGQYLAMTDIIQAKADKATSSITIRPKPVNDEILAKLPVEFRAPFQQGWMLKSATMTMSEYLVHFEKLLNTQEEEIDYIVID